MRVTVIEEREGGSERGGGREREGEGGRGGEREGDVRLPPKRQKRRVGPAVYNV